MGNLLHEDITYNIRGACFSVWKVFAGAFKEKAAERALVIELRKRGRKVEEQKKTEILYGSEKVGYYMPDVIVDDSVLVEIKSKEFLTSEDYDQFWKYLKGSKYKVGLLVNFGSKDLEIKRVVYDSAREKVSASIPRCNPRQSAERGFTLMEIVVATTIFALVVSSLLAIFDYTLKINRKAEALRQAAQGMQNFVEFMVKEVRNGKIAYGVVNGIADPLWPLGACTFPGTGNNTYSSPDNKIAILNDDGSEECIYFADYQKNAISGNSCSTTPGQGQDCTLVIYKSTTVSTEKLNPPNFRIDKLAFYVRPQCDPYTSSCSGGYPKQQPYVTIVIRFTVLLPTGEQQAINYQTTVSTNKYDIPNQ